MSRIGKKPITIPKGVTVAVNGVHVSVQGPKGKLERDLHPLIDVKVDGGAVKVATKGTDRLAKCVYGMTRTLIANMILGVVEPYKKSLEITGVGYRAELKGSAINLQVGLSHEVNHPVPKEVSCQIEKQVLIHLQSCDKEMLGQLAAELRAYRPCEPYNGKGIKYVGERVRRKEGKTGAA